MASTFARRASASALLLLAQACATGPAYDDAGPPPPDAVVCADATPIDQFDALVPRILAALATHPSNFPSARDTYDRFLVYVRARIAAGAVVIDPSRIDACLARLATFGPYDGSFLDSQSPCPDVFRPRCTVPTGARCGSDIDCELSDFCDQQHQMQPCERVGHCTRRPALGEACDWACELSDTGAVACVDTARESKVCAALTSRQTAIAGSPCDQLVAGADGLLTVMQRCAAPLVCVMTGDASGQVLTCGTPTVPGSVPIGAWCVTASDCVASATCDFGETCEAIPASCAGGEGCPLGFACAAGACAATDGSAGAPCGVHSFYSDCAIGLACGSDHRCGPLLPDGAAVDWNTPGECASMCADATFPASGGVSDPRCVPLAP